MNYFEKIDDYHNNLLNDEERAKFEQEIKQNPSLRSAMVNRDIAEEVLNLINEEDIRNEIQRLDFENQLLPREPRSITGPLALLALCVLAMGFLLFQYSGKMQKQKPLDENQLYALHFTPYLSSRTRGTSSYFLRDNNLVRSDSAHFLMNRGERNEAMAILQEVLADQPNPGSHKAEWLYTLCLLKDNDVLGVDSLLNRILSDESHIYYPSAYDLKQDVIKSGILAK